MGVHVAAPVADEPDDRHPEPLPRLDGERGRRAHRAHDGDPRHGGLLHDLERRPSAHLQDVARQGQPARQQLLADHLVDGVVPAHVLTQGDELALRGEQPGRVQTPGPREDLLSGPQPLRQRDEHVGGHLGSGGDGSASHLHVVERRLAADPA